MPTPNLNLADLTASQNQKEVTINDIRDKLEDVITNLISFNITSSNSLTLTNAQFRENYTFDLNPDGGSPPTAQITMTVPGIARGSFAVKNDTAQNVLVRISGQFDPIPVVFPGELAVLVSTGVNIRSSQGADATGASVFIPTNLQTLKKSFHGAIVRRSANLTVADATSTIVPWQTLIRDTLFSKDSNVTVQKFWLGPDLTFTTDFTVDEATATAHGMTTGDGPFHVSSDTTLPAGLSASTNYWAVRVDDNTIQFSTSRSNALAGTVVDLTSNGTGTHTINRQDRLIVPDGVTRIKLNAGILWDNVASGARSVTFWKNNSGTYDGRAEDVIPGESSLDQGRPIESPVIDVSLGDWFTVRVFQNSSGNVDIVDSHPTFFSIEVVESSIILPFPQVIVEKPFRGAMLNITSTQTSPLLFPNGVAWDGVSYDTGFNGTAFWSGASPSRITVPTGVTKVRCKGQLTVDTGYTIDDNIALLINKNGTAGYPGAGIQEFSVGAVGPDVNVSTGVVEVTGGDYFELVILAQDTTFTMGTRSWFSLEVVETTEVLTFPGVTIERPYIGVTLQLNANKSIASGGAVVPWDSAFRDTGYKGTNFSEFAVNPSRITIPFGITKVQFHMKTRWVANATGTRFFRLNKNGAGAPKLTPLHAADDTAFDVFSQGLSTPVLDVVEGDYFEMFVSQDTGAGLSLVHGETWFQMTVIETSEAAFPPEEIDFFINGTPGTTDMIFQKVAARRFSVHDELLNSQAYAVTAPSGGNVAFDVQKNAVSIGTITFNDGVNTATFVTSGGSQVDFDPGDRLSIHSPANLQSMADVSFNIFGFRT